VFAARGASRFRTLRASAESHRTSSYFFIGFKSVYLRAYARMASANNSERGRRSLADSSRRSRSALVGMLVESRTGGSSRCVVGLALLGSSSWSKIYILKICIDVPPHRDQIRQGHSTSRPKPLQGSRGSASASFTTLNQPTSARAQYHVPGSIVPVHSPPCAVSVGQSQSNVRSKCTLDFHRAP